ncbi:MAG: hypothetical protein UR73_C0038G0011 [candidate division WS6 bacterium GW2011_GWF1_35_23]|uniref:Uncharacterized protein n=1 Tax=candidate division WS6 bacterium GW2011_GWF1_35_23 TaxID=1619097 RepID=A0A0G0BZH6_9BACT|nr:MAG: hypothetical protein UR73_C0038G0011 [candidate division WS6 bacterium GW2011_GWF1_35_23]KKQ29795.1 MAG: hypothetical protein US46_C0017G0011 [Candidatus Shapirobacteria bacterium GW2011_GWF2_37_20]
MEEIKKEFFEQTHYLIGNKFNGFEQQAIWNWIETKFKEVERLSVPKIIVEQNGRGHSLVRLENKQ